jgi:hypothetical protein
LAGYKLSVNALFTQSWTASSIDLAFDINYQVVPEPSAGAMLVLGGVALLCVRRLRDQFAA